VHSIKNYNECSQQLRRTADEKFKIEAESYLSFTLCQENQSMYSQNPLLFWRDHGNNFPTLQVLAGLFLGMLAGSVAVESLFSVTGLICNGRRSSLSPATLHKLTFLHDNLDFIIEQCSTSEWENHCLARTNVTWHLQCVYQTLTISSFAILSHFDSQGWLDWLTVISDTKNIRFVLLLLSFYSVTT